MIKIALRRNLIYPIQLIIWSFIRYVEITLLSRKFNFNNSLTFTPLMFLGEFFSGILVHRYQKGFFEKKQPNPENQNLFNKILIQERKSFVVTPVDSDYKIIFLVLVCAISAFIHYMTKVSIVGKFIKVSSTLQQRLGAVMTILSAIYYVHVLKLRIFKHQVFSLIVMGICIIIILILEFVFQEINIFLSYGEFCFALFINFILLFFNTMVDIVEKYLYEYNYVNPFKVLMLEGLCGFIFSLFFFFIPDYLHDLVEVYNKTTRGEFIFFVVLLVLYFLTCGPRNIFRVITNKLYSPMTRSFTDYFLNPLYLFFSFLVNNDFASESEVKRDLYFSFNLILAIIISFFGCVYNEFIVLNFCGLGFNTYYQITQRANSCTELNEIIDITEEDLFNN